MSDQSYSLSEALKQFSDPDAWERFLEAEAVCIERRWVHEHLGWPNDRLAYDPEDDGGEYRDITDQRQRALDAIEGPFKAALRSGQLVAMGYRQPIKADAERVVIEPPMWLFLMPFYTVSAASSTSLRYEGVTVCEVAGTGAAPLREEGDDDLMRRIEAVMEKAASLQGKLKRHRSIASVMIKNEPKKKFEGFSESSIRKILGGTYGAAKRRGFGSLDTWTLSKKNLVSS